MVRTTSIALVVLAVNGNVLTNGPSSSLFGQAAPPAIAEPLINRFADGLRTLGLSVAMGRFGAEMQVELVNDGPVTLMLELP